MKYLLLLNSVGRDGDYALVEKFICKLFGGVSSQSTNVDILRCIMFSKGKRDLQKLPPTNGALKLHYARANYQAKIWLQANQTIMDVTSPVETGGWKETSDGINVVWKKHPSIPAVCLELISCGCKLKCKSASCKCFKNSLRCTPACVCSAVNCCNPSE